MRVALSVGRDDFANMLFCLCFLWFFFVPFVNCLRKIKAPGMADMPGESQEEPSVMVVAMLATIRLTSPTEMSQTSLQVAQGRS